MPVANRLKFTVAITSAAAITPPTAANVVKHRTLADAIAAGELAANMTGVPLVLEDATNWEESYFTVSPDGLSFTRTSVAASSAGGTTPVTFTGTVTVACTPFADYVNKLLISTNGVGIKDLPVRGTLTSTDLIEVSDAAGNTFNATLSALQTFLGGAATAPTETLTIDPITGAKTVGTGFTVSGTWTNVQPAGLNFALTDNGGTQGTFNTATGATINANGTWSFTQNPASASTSRTMVVQDSGRTTVVSAPSNAYVVNAAAAQVITVATPATQTVGTAFNVTGTYANGAPTALDYRLSDDPANQWTAAPGTPTISGGNFSFSLTPSTSSTGRTISVRDRTTLVSGTSGSYVVNAAAAGGVTHTFSRYNGGSNTSADTATITAALTRADIVGTLNDASGTPYAQINHNKMCPSETFWGISPAPAPNVAYIGWGSSNSAPPTQLADAQTDPYQQYAMLPGGCMMIAAVQGTFAGGTGQYFSTKEGVVYVPAAAGTYNRYLWIKPSDGPAHCVNASNPCVITLS